MLISEELEEHFSLSERIAVIYEGEIMGILDARVGHLTPSQERIGLMMAGEQAPERERSVG